MKLEEALRECTLPLLRRIAASHALPAEEDALRMELAVQLTASFLDPSYLERYLGTLEEGELQILHAVRQYGWAAKAFVVDRLCPRRPAPTAGLARQEPASPCLALLQKGLLFRGFGPIGDWRGELYYVPDEMQRAIAQLPTPATSGGGRDVRASITPSSTVECRGEFDLFCLLSYVRRGYRRLSGERLSRSDSEQLEVEAGRAVSLWSGGRAEDRWTLLLHICLARGWVRREGRGLRPGHGALRALAGSPTEQRGRLLDGYLRDRGWSDLEAAGRVRQLLGNQRIDEPSARKVVIHYLEEICGDGWCDEAAFCDSLRTISPDFLREDYASPGWAVVEIASGAELYGPGSWESVEREWLRYLLRGPLYWLGVVRWGRSQDDRPIAFQLVKGENTAATVVLKIAEVGDELRVAAPPQCNLAQLYQFEPYMELLKRASAGSYRLGRDTVLAAMEAGGSHDELVGLLGVLGGESLPDALKQRAAGWAADYGRFTLEAATLLTAESEEDSGWVGSQPGVAPCLGEQLGVSSHRVVPERLWELVEALKRAGQLPRVDPTLRRQGARRIAADSELLRESLFALLVLRAIQPSARWADGANAARKLEAALGTDEVEKVRARADEAIKRARSAPGQRGEEP